MKTNSLLAAAILVGMLLPGIAGAQVFEKLVMPGRVIQGHAEVESDCGSCHDADSDAARASLCTNCHEDIGTDRASSTGFHGRSPAARTTECITCHTDHEGRNADIVDMESGLFDHDYTDFVLTGPHSTPSCVACHRPGARWNEAPTDCASCHSKDDPHQGKLGSQCQNCHNESNWSEWTFNHEATGYTLTGGHADTACGDCHQANAFENTPKGCNSCHAIDDIHRGANGRACQDCHSTSTWRTTGFDHLAETGFALEAGHGNLACDDCHTREDFKDQFPGGCVDCHRTDDDHQGRNGDKCDTCHGTTEWEENSFDHADTGFHLVEAHSNLNCSACHKAERVADVGSTCTDCHALDDVHDEQMPGQCSACHTQTAWHTSVAFDHDLSSFPLTGLHATVACGACHSDNRFQDADTECVSCHRDEDPHEGSLGDDCGGCHTTNEWTSTMFDHGKHTGFDLTGGHSGLVCTDCHTDESAAKSDVPSTCGGCHASDDAHDGEFGTDCGQCHNPFSFREVDAL